jgi:hypothetical protein
MEPHAVITINPSEAEAAAGAQVRFTFAVIQDDAAAYSVESADVAVLSWCRVLLPAVRSGRGELVVDVPADTRPGRYHLRLVATARGREIASGGVTLRIAGEGCLRIVSVPKFSLEAGGTLLVTLRVVNCGIIDGNLLLRAHHEDGWSFSVDAPELVIGVGKGPVTVQVTLRPPIGRRVDRGDRVTLEVETGTGWQALAGRVHRPPWSWVAAAAVPLVVVAAAGAVWWPESDDDDAVTTWPSTSATTTSATAVTSGPDNGTVVDGPDAGLPGDIDVETSQVDFGQVAVGQAAGQTVVFRNIGDQPADATVAVVGDDEIAAEAGCDVVGVGQECDLLITFTPGEAAFYGASVTVGDEAIDVTGEGLADEPVPVEIQSLTVDLVGCTITVAWDAAGDLRGRLALFREGELVAERLQVESGSVTESTFELFGGEGYFDVAYELVAYDSKGGETDRASASDSDTCVG